MLITLHKNPTTTSAIRRAIRECSESEVTVLAGEVLNMLEK